MHTHDLRLPQTGQTLHLGSTASLPTIHAGVKDQSVSCTTSSGKTLMIREQIHLYTPNYLLDHPLISPVLSYLGGLPPLMFIAGDGEVLRDEIIYTWEYLDSSRSLFTDGQIMLGHTKPHTRISIL